MKRWAHQQCINPDCAATFDIGQVLFSCDKCGSLLDVLYDWDQVEVPRDLSFFETRWGTRGLAGEGLLDFSGVWRFRELLSFVEPEHVAEGRRDAAVCGRLGPPGGPRHSTARSAASPDGRDRDGAAPGQRRASGLR